MSNILIIGANRGLGLEFAKQYSELGHHVFATTRDKSKSDQLVAIANTTVLELDLNEDISIDRFIDEMSSIKIDILSP